MDLGDLGVCGVLVVVFVIDADGLCFWAGTLGASSEDADDWVGLNLMSAANSSKACESVSIKLTMSLMSLAVSSDRLGMDVEDGLGWVSFTIVVWSLSELAAEDSGADPLSEIGEVGRFPRAGHVRMLWPTLPHLPHLRRFITDLIT